MGAEGCATGAATGLDVAEGGGSIGGTGIMVGTGIVGGGTGAAPGVMLTLNVSCA